MIDFHDIDLIEQYLFGDLDKSTAQLVAQKIEQEASYAQEIKLYATTIEAIKLGEKAKLKEQIKTTHQTLKEKSFFADFYSNNLDKTIIGGIKTDAQQNLKNAIKNTHSNLKDKGFFDNIYDELAPPTEPSIAKKWTTQWIAIAASITLILCIGSYFLFFSTPTLFEQEFALYPDKIGQEINTQLNATGFKPIDKKAIAKLQEGMEFYNNKNLELAIPIFEQYLISGEDQWRKTDIQFYLAISYLGLSESDKAQNILFSLNQSEEFQDLTSVQWYLALSYIQKENKDKAIPLLKNLEKDTVYGIQAKELIKKL